MKVELSDVFTHKIDTKTRTLFLTQVDDDVTDAQVFETFLIGLHLLEGQNKKPITVLMNHDGGDEMCNMGIYDAIKASECHITTVVYGNAQSMGAWILQAADKRVMMPSAKMMLHVGENSAPNDHTKNNIKMFEEVKRDMKMFEDVLLDRIKEKQPKYTRRKLQNLLNFNTYLRADEALKLGLIDQVGL